jgi:hypothetical protein
MNEIEQKFVKPLIRALQRLERSKTKLTRRNALLEWSAAMRDIQSTVRHLYPKMRPDGSAIIRKPVRGRRCPRCRIPLKSVTVLVKHLAESHGEPARTCPCGWRPIRESTTGISPSYTQQKAKHLGGVKDLDVHYARAAIVQSANRNIGSGESSR